MLQKDQLFRDLLSLSRERVEEVQKLLLSGREDLDLSPDQKDTVQKLISSLSITLMYIEKAL